MYELQEAYDKYGDIPVEIDYSYSDRNNNALVRHVLADEKSVIIYNWR